MAKQNILVGASANDKAGDTLRNAFVKVNANFTELYTLTGGTAADLQELAQDYAAPLFNHASHVNITATYDDANNKILLTGTPAQVQTDWNASSGLGVVLNKPTIPSAYTLPTASSSVLGGIKIGTGLSIDVNGVVTASSGSVSSLVNGAKTVSLGTNSILTLPAPLALLTSVSQLATDTAKIYRATNSTDLAAIQTAWDNWYGNEQMFREMAYQDAQISGGSGSTRPWAGLPSWEAYPLIMNYVTNPPGGSQLPPPSNLGPAAKVAQDSYLAYKELVSSIDIVNGNKTISFDNTGVLSLPGKLEFKDAANAKIILKSIGAYGHVVEDPTLDKTWTFNANGSLTFPNDTTQTTAWTGSVSSLVNGSHSLSLGSTGNTTFPTGLVLGAPRGSGTVNFTSAIDKEFQIETQTASTGKLWRFETNGNTTLPTGLTFRKNGTPYSTITADLDKVLQIETQTSGGVKQWSLGTDGALTVPGIITKANTLQITSSGATNAAAIIASGDNGRVTLRTDNGTTNKDWYFNIDGVLTTAGSVKLPNNSELRPSTAAYDSAMASWEYIRSGEITDRITNNLATAEGWPMVDWHPTGLTAQGYIDFLLNAWTVQNTLGGTLIVYPAMSSSFYQQMRTILINIRDNYSLTSSGVSISSGYAKSWNFNEDGKLTFPDGTSQTGAGVQSIHGSLTTANAGGYTVTRNGLTVSIVWDNTSGVAGIIKIAFDSNTMVTERTVTLRASSQVNSSYIGTNTALTANQAYTIATLTNLGDFSTTHIITGNYNIYRITTVLQQADAPGGNPVAAGYATIEQLR